MRAGGVRRATCRGAVLFAVALVGAGCTAGADARHPSAATAPSSSRPPAARSSANPAQPVAYDLLTHCGIREARLGSTYFAADHPLVVEYHAPAGWDDPVQHGTMTLLTPSRAVFRDDRGHEVYFSARAGATSFSSLCQ